MTNENFFEMFIESARKAYIEIIGEEKWISLTDKEKHDAVMIMAKDMMKATNSNEIQKSYTIEKYVDEKEQELKDIYGGD